MKIINIYKRKIVRTIKVISLSILGIFFTFSCQERKTESRKEKETVIYTNGDTVTKLISGRFPGEEIERTYIKERLKFELEYKNKILKTLRNYLSDSIQNIVQYNEKQEIITSGYLLYDSIPYSFWTYKEDGGNEKIVEYVILCNGESYINQLWNTSKENVTDSVEVIFGFNISKNKDFYNVEYEYHGLNTESELFLFLSDKNDFCSILNAEKIPVMINLKTYHSGIFKLENMNYTKGFFYERYYTYPDTLKEEERIIIDRKTFIDLKGMKVPSVNVLSDIELKRR